MTMKTSPMARQSRKRCRSCESPAVTTALTRTTVARILFLPLLLLVLTPTICAATVVSGVDKGTDPVSAVSNDASQQESTSSPLDSSFDGRTDEKDDYNDSSSKLRQVEPNHKEKENDKVSLAESSDQDQDGSLAQELKSGEQAEKKNNSTQGDDERAVPVINDPPSIISPAESGVNDSSASSLGDTKDDPKMPLQESSSSKTATVATTTTTNTSEETKSNMNQYENEHPKQTERFDNAAADTDNAETLREDNENEDLTSNLSQEEEADSSETNTIQRQPVPTHDNDAEKAKVNRALDQMVEERINAMKNANADDKNLEDPTRLQQGTDDEKDELENEDVVDDRSLLDVFGESCKEFLTQKMIPETDEECHWDWRSLRCEDACDCEFQGRWGDYHLGRSCRRSRFDGEEDEREVCIPVDPALVLREAPIPKRVISLVSQTLDIVTTETHRLIQRLRSKIIQLWERQVLERICSENWALEQRVLAEQQNRQAYLLSNKNNTTCISESMALTLESTRSFWERNFCGPSITEEYPVCEQTTTTLSSSAANGNPRPGPSGATMSSFSSKWRNNARPNLNIQQ